MGRFPVEAKVVDVQKRRAPSKHYVYVIEVTFSEGSTLYVYRRYSMFFDMHTHLLEEFPKAAGADGAKRIIPYLPGKKLFARSQTHQVAQARAPLISEYVQALVKLPKEISQSERVVSFFEPNATDIAPPKINPETGKEEVRKKTSKRDTVVEAEVSDVLLLDQYVAVADYKKQAKGELSVRAGMIVEIVEKKDTGWWFATAEGNQGWVPATFLEPVDTETTSDGIETVPESKAKHITLQKYKAEEADEVSFEKAAVVFVREKRLDGWWKVEYNGQCGWAPGSYLKPAPVQDYKPIVLGGGAGAAAGGAAAKAPAPPKPSKPEAPARPEPAVKNPPLRRSMLDADGSKTKSVVAMALEAQQKGWAKKSGGGVGGGGGGDAPSAAGRSGSAGADEDIKDSQYHITKAAFTKQDDSGISFPAGAKVEVMEGDSGSGWTYILYNGEEGWAPSDYLEPAKKKAAPAVPALPAKPKAPGKPAVPAAPKPGKGPKRPKAATRTPSTSSAAKPAQAAGASKQFKSVLEQAREKQLNKVDKGPALPAKPHKPGKPEKPEPPLPPLPADASAAGTHVAVADYRAESDVETSLTKGMSVTAGEMADGWTMVTTPSGAEGWVPSEFIKASSGAGGGASKAPALPAKPKAAAKAPAIPSKPKAAAKAPAIPSKPKAAAKAPPIPAKPSGGGRYRCVGDFRAETDQELSMSAGETCTCEEPAVDGWLYVTKGGKSGYVPQDYLTRA